MKQSAGILVYRSRGGITQVLLAHPGGPFWKNKDKGAWSIPKGEFEKDEDPLAAAKREMKEETGIDVKGKFIPMQPVKTRSKKIVLAFAINADPDISGFISNTILIQWPPGSGKQITIQEIDRIEWFELKEAREKILEYQLPLIDELSGILTK